MRSFMTENTIKNINFDYIFNEVKPITEYGIKIKQEAAPFVKGQEADLKAEFNRIRAFIELKQRRDIIDVLKHIKNILETIDRAKGNQVLDEVELFEIKNFLILVEKMDKILRGISIKDLKLPQLTPLPQLYEKLDPASERINTFYIYDEYSEKLKNIRNEKRLVEKNVRLLKKKIKEEIQNKHGIKLNLKDEATIGKAQKDKIEELNKEDNLRISGENYLNIIYKIKNTDEIDALEQRYEHLSLEEDDEEYKIRQDISKEIKEVSHILQKNTVAIGEIDYIIAKANYAQKTKSIEPEIINDLQIVIKGGRNLKLEKTLKDKHIEYVPIDLNLNKNVACITGANMGGKTVSLRMIGQIAAMASLGMFVPCEYAKLCLFEHIYISVGDDQSIEKGLSTFGAEIVNLKEAIKIGKRKKFLKLTRQLEWMGLREHPKYMYVYAVDVLRHNVLKIAEQFVSEDRLNKAEDIFYLTREEITKAQKDKNLDLISLINEEKKIRKLTENVKNWPTIFSSRGEIFIAKREAKEGELSGEPVAPGVVRGRAKVLYEPFEKKLEKGEILVTIATEPSWTPIFINACAVVMEIGGALQHGAIIAREYGLPCVTGIEKATEMIKDGDLIEVDGTNGFVKIIKE